MSYIEDGKARRLIQLRRLGASWTALAKVFDYTEETPAVSLVQRYCERTGVPFPDPDPHAEAPEQTPGAAPAQEKRRRKRNFETLPDKRAQQICADYSVGTPIRDIAELQSLPYHVVRNVLLDNLVLLRGQDARGWPGPTRDDRAVDVMALYLSGFTWPEIARKLHYLTDDAPRELLEDHCERMRIPFPTPGQPARPRRRGLRAPAGSSRPPAR